MRLLWGSALALLAGCASFPNPQPPVDLVAAQVAQDARSQALGLETGACDAPSWVMTGRVALSNGKQGGSGQIEWTQGAGQLRLLLTAPVTRQGWLLEASSAGATLQVLSTGAQVQGGDAGQLLQQATGWDVPVRALGCWMRAVAADSVQFGQAQLYYGANLLPSTLEQAGWRLRYGNWQQDPFSHQQMPSRIEATRGSDRVRLIVERWGLE